MPEVTVRILEGCTEEQKKALVAKVTAAISETTVSAEEDVVIFIEEVSPNHYAVGGRRLSDR